MNYSEMSDFEINKAVAVAQGYPAENCDFGWTGKPDVGVEWNDETGYPTKSFNYCNSWADAGPIIQDKGISLTYVGKGHLRGEWGADAPSGKPYLYGGNPLRATMIVYLMMHDKGEE